MYFLNSGVKGLTLAPTFPGNNGTNLTFVGDDDDIWKSRMREV